jgi:hypothetical protein
LTFSNLVSSPNYFALNAFKKLEIGFADVVPGVAALRDLAHVCANPGGRVWVEQLYASSGGAG